MPKRATSAARAKRKKPPRAAADPPEQVAGGSRRPATADPPEQVPAGSRRPAAKVLVVDDHPVIRSGLEFLMRDEPDMQFCGGCETAREAFEQIERYKPDVVVVDLMLGNEAGIELVKDIVSRHPEVRTVVFSWLSEAAYAERAMHAGACGYVEKSNSPESIIDAIRTVRNGGMHISSQVAQQMARRLQCLGNARISTAEETLSDREMEVFERIGRGDTPSEIAQGLKLSVKTVATYRDRVRDKLGLSSAGELRHVAAQWWRCQTCPTSHPSPSQPAAPAP